MNTDSAGVVLVAIVLACFALTLLAEIEHWSQDIEVWLSAIMLIAAAAFVALLFADEIAELVKRSE